MSATPYTCPGCGTIYDAPQACEICATFARMRERFHRLKGRGSFVEASQPPETNEDLAELMREHPAFREDNRP